jgi:hypothetical protein
MSARRYAKETFDTSGGTATTTALATLVTALRAADASTRGISIDDGRGITAVVSCPSGQTLTSGAMRCYVYMAVDRNADGSIPTRRWVKYPALDVDIISDTSILASTERDIPLGDKIILSGAGRLCWLPDAVIHSGSSGAATVGVVYSLNRWSE